MPRNQYTKQQEKVSDLPDFTYPIAPRTTMTKEEVREYTKPFWDKMAQLKEQRLLIKPF